MARDYVALACEALLELVRSEHAVVWPEVEAKIADTKWPGAPLPIDPHHLTTARSHLRMSGFITDEAGILAPSDLRGRHDAHRNAERRRRALNARMAAWARSSKQFPGGRIGAAGERVLHASLLQAAAHGVRPVQPSGGEIKRLLGVSLDQTGLGPLDNAAWVTQDDESGVPQSPTLCPMEVKNIRHWIYPSSAELFQLLHKAAYLQEQLEEQAICPVLICRRVNFSAERMSKDLGFRILEVRRQFVRPVESVKPEAVDELRNELGYDLLRHDSAHPTVVKPLIGTLRSSASTNAARWREAGPALLPYFKTLRDTGLSAKERSAALEDLREVSSEFEHSEGGW